MAAISNELQQAIALARAGKTSAAHDRAAQVLASEPDNTHALFLMSTLAESPEAQADYLHRVLKIDPDYEAARERLDQLSVPEGQTVQPETESEEEELPDTMIMEASLYEQGDEVEETSMAEAEVGDEQDEGHGALFARTTSTDEAEGAEIDFDDVTGEGPPVEEAQTAEAESEPLSLLEQSKAGSVPDWLKEAGGFDEAIAESEPDWSPEEIAAQEELEDIPDWLQDEPEDDWLDQTVADDQALWSDSTSEAPPDEVVAATPTAEIGGDEPDEDYPAAATEGLDLEAELATSGAAGEPAPTPAERSRPRSSTRIYEIILLVLIVLAILVVAALAYVIIVPPF